MNRYERQMVLPEVGSVGQARLQAARVLVVGAGGVAAPVLQYLSGAGIGQIMILDPDKVEVTNLHCQPMYRFEDIGRAKVDVAQQYIAKLNTDVCTYAYRTSIHPDNVSYFVKQVDLVLDCADSYAASYMLSDACMQHNCPLISASVLGQKGYVGGFCGSAPSFRSVFPDMPNQSLTCATAGMLGPAAGMVGAMQAHMALTLLLGNEPNPLGRMFTLNLTNYMCSTFSFKHAQEPSGPSFPFVSMMGISYEDWVIDLRSSQEATELVHPMASRYPLERFMTEQPRPKTGQRAILACRSGSRAWMAAKQLSQYWSGDIQLVAIAGFARA